MSFWGIPAIRLEEETIQTGIVLVELGVILGCELPILKGLKSLTKSLKSCARWSCRSWGPEVPVPGVEPPAWRAAREVPEPAMVVFLGLTGERVVASTSPLDECAGPPLFGM